MVKNAGFLSRMACRGGLLLGLFSGVPSGADPLADYVQACEAWNSRDAARPTCSALVERLSGLASPKPAERLALFKARVWLGDFPNASYGTYCDGVRAIADYLPDHPEVLFNAALCEGPRRAERSAALVLRALEVDPEYTEALDFLAGLVWRRDEDLGVDAATLAQHRRTLYEVAEGDNGKIDAAVYIYAAAVDGGDPNAATAIREKVRRDLAFDALDYGPEHRADSLQRTCGDERLFYLDLERLCIDAIGMLSGDAAAVGESIPDDVLSHIGDAFDLFHYRKWKTGPKTGAVARLKAVLDALPEPLRSSEHYRVYARTTRDWADRVGPLRRAVDLDSGNFAAHCDLADALALTGELDEAWSLYMQIKHGATTSVPCNFEGALLSLDQLNRQD